MSTDTWVPRELPSGWATARLDKLCEVVRGGSPRPMGDPRYFGGTIPFLKIADVTRSGGTVVHETTTKVTPEGALRSRLIQAGRLVLTNSATVCVPVFLGVDACIHDGFVAFEGLPDFVDQKYLFHFFKYIRPYVLDKHRQGVTQVNLNTGIIGEMSLLLPPANEQRRIVAKIEELFSELDKAMESLTSARAQLKVYRQALLRHTFEGKLTADWRDRTKLKPVADLRRNIRSELLRCHERELESWRLALEKWEKGGCNGKRPSKPRPPQPTPELTGHDLALLPEIPKGWQWVRLGELAWSVRDGPHFSPQYSSEGIPFISGGNIRPDGIDFSAAKYISRDLHRTLSERCKPEKGDLLYTKGGTTGIARVNDCDLEFNVWVHVAVLKLVPSVRPFYLQHALNSPRCYAQAQKYTHGVGNQDLGLTRMVNIILPICSEVEQRQIEESISQTESELKTLGAALENELGRSIALRQSILQAAFSGKLVLQDPNDEPASVLIERIRSERVDRSTKTTKRKQRPKGEAA